MLLRMQKIKLQLLHPKYCLFITLASFTSNTHNFCAIFPLGTRKSEGERRKAGRVKRSGLSFCHTTKAANVNHFCKTLKKFQALGTKNFIFLGQSPSPFGLVKKINLKTSTARV